MPKGNVTDLIDAAEIVTAAAREGKDSYIVEGIEDTMRGGTLTFDFADRGRCQENSCKLYQWVTDGEIEPGADASAWATYLNLQAGPHQEYHTWDALPVGGFAFLEEGSVGHTGVKVSATDMFQNTSRDDLGTGTWPLTDDQVGRFAGGFMLLPTARTKSLWGAAVNVADGRIMSLIWQNDLHRIPRRIYLNWSPRGLDKLPVPDEARAGNVWGLAVPMLQTTPPTVIGTITYVDDAHGMVYVLPGGSEFPAIDEKGQVAS
jgi:hypothetical protein